MTKQTEALRMAIELMERFLEHDSISSSDYIDVRNACIKALEPTVAELNDEYLRDTHVEGMPKAETQKPVAFRNNTTGEFCTGGFELRALNQWTPLYTTPPSREWVGLSDEEIAKLTLYSSEYTSDDGFETISLDEKHFVCAIEAKLREING